VYIAENPVRGYGFHFAFFDVPISFLRLLYPLLIDVSVCGMVKTLQEHVRQFGPFIGGKSHGFIDDGVFHKTSPESVHDYYTKEPGEK